MPRGPPGATGGRGKAPRMSAAGNMTFRRYGRSYHVVIATAADLRRVVDLDEAHWVATGAPVAGLNGDPTFLALVDSDRNGRIMCRELTDAISWLLLHLTDYAGVAAGSRALRLDAVNAERPEGAAIRGAAAKMLARLGRPDAGEITLEQVRQVKREVEGTPISEAGVVLPEAAEGEDLRQFIADVIATVGGAAHPSGREGVGRMQLETFVAKAEAHLAWLRRGEVPAGEERTEVMPLGAETPKAFAAFAALRPKLDQYFAQCDALAYDGRVAGRVGPTEAELAEMDFADPGAIDAMLLKAPLAPPRADRTLIFAEATNPRYASELETFRVEAAAAALGGPVASLSLEQWQRVKAFFAAHEAWTNAREGAEVAPLGVEALARHLEGRCAEEVRELIAASARTAFAMDNIRLTEKLLLYQAHLTNLANNFVSFPALYDMERRAMFEMGTLVMDGRRFNLAVRVADRAAHAAVAAHSDMFVLYVEVMSKEGETVYEVAVPVTSGGKGNLCVGKRGVFEDVRGREWDARVGRIIENPISVGEALVAPFRRIAALITGKIESLTTQAEKKLDTTTTGAISRVEKPGEPSAGGRGLMAGGLLMGGGVAVAALASAVAYFTKTLAGLHWWEILIGVGGAVLAVIVPTSIVAFLKLRRRDLSAVLEGSGWAVNARMRLTRAQSRFFTRRPTYPEGARGVRRRGRWLLVLLALIVLIAAAGLIRRACRSGRPAATAPTTRPAP